MTEHAVQSWLDHVKSICADLATSRPTAVNLFWALDRMMQKANELVESGASLDDGNDALEAEALLIQKRTKKYAALSAKMHCLCSKMGWVTHSSCNAGGLATAKYGTATAPMYLAQERGINLKVFADETRPVLQGARLTAFELQQAGIDVTLLCDNMAGMVMSKGWIQAVMV